MKIDLWRGEEKRSRRQEEEQQKLNKKKRNSENWTKKREENRKKGSCGGIQDTRLIALFYQVANSPKTKDKNNNEQVGQDQKQV